MRRRRGSLWIGLLLAVILTIGSLTGCRSGGTAQQPQENAAVLQSITEEEPVGSAGSTREYRTGNSGYGGTGADKPGRGTA